MVFGVSVEDLASAIEQTGWSEGVETGISILDGQHRKYFDLVNGYLNSASKVSRSDTDQSKLVDKLDFLIRYAMEHFSTEQKIMKEEAYPDYQQHFEEHMYFLKHVNSLRDQIRDSGHSDNLTREIHFYALEWFVSHILFTDMKLVEFLQEKRRA